MWIVSTSAGIFPALPIIQHNPSVPIKPISGSQPSPVLKFKPNNHIILESIFYYDSQLSFSFNILQFAIFVPNFLTIFNVVFPDISANLSSFRAILSLFYSKYLLQCSLAILINSTCSIPILASTVTDHHITNSIPSSTSIICFPSQSEYLPTINKNISIPSALSAAAQSTPYIPRSISAISKSPTPEKWTLALSEEIKTFIS